MKMNHRKTRMRTLSCSLEQWARCSTRKVDKATSEEEDLKEDLKRKERKWSVLPLQKNGSSNCGLPLFTSYNLQECAKEEEGDGGHVG